MNIINKPPYVAITGVGKAHGEIEVNNEQMSLLVRDAVYKKLARAGIDLVSNEAKKILPDLLTNRRLDSVTYWHQPKILYLSGAERPCA